MSSLVGQMDTFFNGKKNESAIHKESPEVIKSTDSDFVKRTKNNRNRKTSKTDKNSKKSENLNISKMGEEKIVEQSQVVEQSQNVQEGKEELQLMEYYEKGDMVFARSNRGFFEPGVVIKVLEDYKVYKIRFIGTKAQKILPIDELKDYNSENLHQYESQINIAPDKEANRIKKVIAAAKQVQQKLKYDEQDQIKKSLEVEEKKIQEEAEKKSESQQPTDKLESQKMVGEIKTESAFKRVENIIIQNSPALKSEYQSSDLSIVQSQKPILRNIYSDKFKNIVDTEVEEAKKTFWSTYMEASLKVNESLKQLNNLSERTLSELTTHILKKFSNMITEESEQERMKMASERYGNLSDILSHIFRNNLLSIKELISSRIIIKSILFIWSYEEFEKTSQSESATFYEYQLVKSMVKYWYINFEKECENIMLNEEQIVNRHETLKKLKFFEEKCKHD